LWVWGGSVADYLGGGRHNTEGKGDRVAWLGQWSGRSKPDAPESGVPTLDGKNKHEPGQQRREEKAARISRVMKKGIWDGTEYQDQKLCMQGPRKTG